MGFSSLNSNEFRLHFRDETRYSDECDILLSFRTRGQFLLVYCIGTFYGIYCEI